MNLSRKLLFATIVLLIGANSQGRDLDESTLMLQEAMMESNADYNKHKKKANHEEFDRADNWSERNTQAILINERINVTDLSEFQEARQALRRNDRDVSSNN